MDKSFIIGGFSLERHTPGYIRATIYTALSGQNSSHEVQGTAC